MKRAWREVDGGGVVTRERSSEPRCVSVDRSRQGAPLDGWVQLPRDGVSGGRGTLIAVHGIGRDAGEQLSAWSGWANARRWGLAVPRFTKEQHPQYQRLAPSPGSGGVRSSDSLLQWLAWIEVHEGELPRPWVLFGHSGGAQFAHRFALLHPYELAAVIVSSAGWYTWPEAQSSFPFGLHRAPLGDRDGRLRSWLKLPFLVTVGTRDVERDGSLRCSEDLDRTQGSDRVTRAGRWVAAMTRCALAQGIQPRLQLRPLAGAGHAFQDCLRAGLAGAMGSFVQGVLPACSGAVGHGSKERPGEGARPIRDVVNLPGSPGAVEAWR